MSAASKQRREQCQLSASKDLSSVSCQQTKTGTVSVVSKQRREQCQQPANKDGNSVSCQQAKTGTVSVWSRDTRTRWSLYSSPLPSPSHTNSTNKDVNSLRLYKYLDEVLDVQIYRFPPFPPPPPTHTHIAYAANKDMVIVSAGLTNTRTRWSLFSYNTPPLLSLIHI